MSATWTSRRGPRGGPGAFERRLERVEQVLDGDAAELGAAREPLVLLGAVLRHQHHRALTIPTIPSRSHADHPPLLDLQAMVPVVIEEVLLAVDALGASAPEPLREHGDQMRSLAGSERAAIVETWMDDVSLVEPRFGAWVHIAAGPVLELSARDAGAGSSNQPYRSWRGTACPMCGGRPEASVIAEESGEFMAGSPRSLVCGRCATWWSFPRATCVECGEANSRLIESYLADGRPWARVDTCATCRSYVKTFDLREPGAEDVVPLVDDLTTLTLDVWVQQRGFSRSSTSLAGV